MSNNKTREIFRKVFSKLQGQSFDADQILPFAETMTDRFIDLTMDVASNTFNESFEDILVSGDSPNETLTIRKLYELKCEQGKGQSIEFLDDVFDLQWRVLDREPLIASLTYMTEVFYYVVSMPYPQLLIDLPLDWSDFICLSDQMVLDCRFNE